ncbi:MAG: cytochrome c [Bacteroidales bacterium]|nr:cytochrome c [Bacteroidales bacterium]
MRASINILIILVCIVFSSEIVAQTSPWLVSESDAAKINSFPVTPKNVAVGKNIFAQSCVSCHGSKADGNGLMKSTSLISAVFQKQTDGAIFYKLSIGKGQMPSFKSLKEEDRWALVNYLRVLVNPTMVPAAVDVKLDITTSESPNSVTAFVTASDSTKTPIADIDVHFYVKRDFGMMRIGHASNPTSADGKVTVVVPDDIIGNSEGNLTIVTKIENNFLYNDVESSVTKQWGKQLATYDEQFNQRELWGAQDKAPIWLLLLANAIILGVWSAIFYVIFSLAKLKKAGKIFTK